MLQPICGGEGEGVGIFFIGYVCVVQAGSLYLGHTVSTTARKRGGDAIAAGTR